MRDWEQIIVVAVMMVVVVAFIVWVLVEVMQVWLRLLWFSGTGYWR